jgi:ribose transport system permease protein
MIARILGRSGVERLSILYLWAVFIVLFGIWSPDVFLTMDTARSIASQQAVAGVLALAVLIPITAGSYDLSVGANANLTGIVVMGLQTQHHWAFGTSLAVGIAIGLTIGAVNGFIVVGLGVDSFIATLGMGSVLAAFLVIVTGANLPSPVTGHAFNQFTQASVGGFQLVVVYMLVLGLVTWWLLNHSPVGRYLYAIGGNADAARLSGVKVGRYRWFTLIAAGGLAGFGGILYSSLTGPSLTFGPTLVLPAFAAVFLGSTQFQPGRFNTWGAIVSIFVLATGVQGLQFVSGQAWLGDMFNGVALIVAVSLAVARDRLRTRHRAGGTGRREAPPAREAALAQQDTAGSMTMAKEKV